MMSKNRKKRVLIIFIILLLLLGVFSACQHEELKTDQEIQVYVEELLPNTAVNFKEKKALEDEKNWAWVFDLGEDLPLEFSVYSEYGVKDLFPDSYYEYYTDFDSVLGKYWYDAYPEDYGGVKFHENLDGQSGAYLYFPYTSLEELEAGADKIVDIASYIKDKAPDIELGLYIFYDDFDRFTGSDPLVSISWLDRSMDQSSFQGFADQARDDFLLYSIQCGLDGGLMDGDEKAQIIAAHPELHFTFFDEAGNLYYSKDLLTLESNKISLSSLYKMLDLLSYEVWRGMRAIFLSGLGTESFMNFRKIKFS